MDNATRQLLNCIRVPIFVLEACPKGRPIYAAFNTTAQEVSGIAEADVIGLTAEEVWGAERGGATYRWHRSALEGGRPISYFLTLPIRGRARRVRTHIVPYKDEHGAVRGVIGTSELPDTADENAMTDFVGLVAHDLRSPLQNIRGLAAILRDDTDIDLSERGDMLGTILKVAETADQAVDDVLSYCRVTGAREELSQFSLFTVVKGIVSVLDPTGNCLMQCEDAAISGDRVVVYVVMRNLIDNAIKHAGDTPRIGVCGKQRQDGQFEISVKNSGTAPPPGLSYMLATGQVRSGGGFGLYGASRIVEERGGRMWLLDDDDGADFRFSLPGYLEKMVAPA